jgi:hypothetical protein
MGRQKAAPCFLGMRFAHSLLREMRFVSGLPAINCKTYAAEQPLATHPEETEKMFVFRFVMCLIGRRQAGTLGLEGVEESRRPAKMSISPSTL